MPATAPSPLQRRARIAALIGANQVWSQQELADLLRRREGIAVTQATLSRDLTELGVVKGPAGYMLAGAPGAGAGAGAAVRGLRGRGAGVSPGDAGLVIGSSSCCLDPDSTPPAVRAPPARARCRRVPWHTRHRKAPTGRAPGAAGRMAALPPT